MFVYPTVYDVIVVGAGHAGCEAALASARMGSSTLLLSGNLDTIAHMSCNPAIGGLAKGHLVKEIDALGGEMGKNTDATGIQFRRLNLSKGPAVRATRAQSDRNRYKERMKRVIEETLNLTVKQALVESLVVENGIVKGVTSKIEEFFQGRTVILTTGTFLSGLMHYGLKKADGGRAGDFSAKGLSKSLIESGFELGRLKTGTVPRLDAKTIDWSGLEVQHGDNPPPLFSFSETKALLPQRPCYVTYTSAKTHDVIRANLDRSPMYCGEIEGIGPRYCPSIEDKVVRFADKDRHQLFLEPEGLDTKEIYVNGMSTSLPVDVQIEMVRSVAGLEHAEIMRPGYAVEYDFVPPTQLYPTLETKRAAGLFHAGQINGTSGYEEAAAQGLVAGINAALKVKGEPPLIFDRSTSYIGVMVDDLVTKGTPEPYRMFTSRAEYRLLLREDNADLRLRAVGRKLGLIGDADWNRFQTKKSEIEKLFEMLTKTMLNPDASTNQKLVELGTMPLKKPASVAELIRRPEMTLEKGLQKLGIACEASLEVNEQVEIQIKYEGYIRSQNEDIGRFKKLETIAIPGDFSFVDIAGLSKEVQEKLGKIRPQTLGQASRISGITPAAISILMVYLKSLEKSLPRTGLCKDAVLLGRAPKARSRLGGGNIEAPAVAAASDKPLHRPVRSRAFSKLVSILILFCLPFSLGFTGVVIEPGNALFIRRASGTVDKAKIGDLFFDQDRLANVGSPSWVLGLDGRLFQLKQDEVLMTNALKKNPAHASLHLGAGLNDSLAMVGKMGPAAVSSVLELHPAEGGIEGLYPVQGAIALDGPLAFRWQGKKIAGKEPALMLVNKNKKSQNIFPLNNKGLTSPPPTAKPLEPPPLAASRLGKSSQEPQTFQEFLLDPKVLIEGNEYNWYLGRMENNQPIAQSRVYTFRLLSPKTKSALMKELIQIDGLPLAKTEGRNLLRAEVYYKYQMFHEMIEVLEPVYRTTPTEGVRRLLFIGNVKLNRHAEAQKFSR